MREVEPKWRGAVFICHNGRDPAAKRASCGGERGAAVRAWLRDRLREEGHLREVLCSRSGCLDVCSGEGVTVALLHADGAPREVLVVRHPEDLDALLARVVTAFGLESASR